MQWTDPNRRKTREPVVSGGYAHASLDFPPCPNTVGSFKQSMTKVLIVMSAFLLMAMARNVAADQMGESNGWVNISDPVVAALTNAGVTIPWPGNTGGVAVDRVSGSVCLDVCNLGLWQSTDQGRSFHRIAEGKISGRCEFGYAINGDSAGGRMACLLLDGQGGLTLDGGRTWQPFAQVGRNWEYGAVDWSDPQARAIFADRHESGGEMYLSSDAGATWKFLGKHPEWASLGVFDASTLVVGTTNGILRSTDGGATWAPVSTLHPVGRLAVYFQGLTYSLAQEGLITSGDKGATWQVTGAAREAGWGPFFGKDARTIVVADTQAFWQTTDGGRTWKRLAPLPPFPGGFAPTVPGQFLSVGWDPQANLLYASRLGNPTFRLQLGK